jgi:hypothetical protein
MQNQITFHGCMRNEKHNRMATEQRSSSLRFPRLVHEQALGIKEDGKPKSLQLSEQELRVWQIVDIAV